jgi:hypothetical protein
MDPYRPFKGASGFTIETDSESVIGIERAKKNSRKTWHTLETSESARYSAGIRFLVLS